MFEEIASPEKRFFTKKTFLGSQLVIGYQSLQLRGISFHQTQTACHR